MIMNYSDYLKLKQKQWAVRHGLSVDEKGYLPSYNENIFGGLPAEVEQMFRDADGNELTDMAGRPAKMKALHSSSALCVNVFGYLRYNVGSVFSSLGISRLLMPPTREILFEYKNTIIAGSRPSHLDMMLTARGHFYAVESKFLEPYSYSPNILKSKYLATDGLWDGLPCIHEYVSDMEDCADGTHLDYSCLDAAQLIKHLLGLMRNESINGDKSRFHLIYLYYDTPDGIGMVHRAEIASFAKLMARASVNFKAVTYQEVLYTLNTILDYNSHKEYLDYINERYM